MAYRERRDDFEEREYYPMPRRGERDFEEDIDVDVRVRERERERDRTPAFLRPQERRTDAGQMVLRKRDVETFDRRQRSPSPARPREVRRPRSMVPPQREAEFDESIKIVERERRRSPSVVRRRRSPSPQAPRYVERRPRSDSSSEHDHIRIIERERARAPSPSPSPSPPPPPPTVFKGKEVIEREVITHYRDIDHGTIQVRKPSPKPAPRPRERGRDEFRETDIDIDISRGRTEVDVRQRSSSHRRSKSRPRNGYYDDELDVVINDTNRLRIDDAHRRSRSAAPIRTPIEEEAEYITGKIDSRGRMGEAWGGATRDWAIVDVPPGTERVRMDGAGGGSTDTSWSRYSGVRRTQFVPERDRESARASSRDGRTSLVSYDREREIDIDIEIDRRRKAAPPPPPPPPAKEMWTEVTKDLVVREAIERIGYSYEETGEYFYIMEYLSSDKVVELTFLTEKMRKSWAKRRPSRDVEWETDIDIHRHDRHGGRRDDRMTEVMYDSKRPARRYFRG